MKEVVMWWCFGTPTSRRIRNGFLKFFFSIEDVGDCDTILTVANENVARRSTWSARSNSFHGRNEVYPSETTQGGRGSEPTVVSSTFVESHAHLLHHAPSYQTCLCQAKW